MKRVPGGGRDSRPRPKRRAALFQFTLDMGWSLPLLRASEALRAAREDPSGALASAAQHSRAWARRSITPRNPGFLLALLVLFHVLVGAVHHAEREYFPAFLVHSGYTLVVDQTRMLQGHTALNPANEYNQGFKTLFVGQRELERRWWLHPRVLWKEVRSGRLQGLWHSTGYWNEISLNFFAPAVVHELTGGSLAAVALTPQLFLAILLISVFCIGRRAGGPWTGLAAAAIASGYSGLYSLVWTHHDSLATAAMITALVYLILRSDGFSRLGTCAWGGLVAALATRVGESVATTTLVGMAAAGPFVLEMVRLVRRSYRRPRGTARGLAGVALFLLPATLLFEWHRLAVMRGMTEHSWNEIGIRAQVGPAVPHHLAGLASDLAYLFSFASDLVQPVMTAWLLLGLATLWRAPRGDRLALILVAAVPLVVMSPIPKKATSYIIPLLPALALITALGLRGWRSPTHRRALLGLAAACGIAMPLFQTLTPNAFLDIVVRNPVSLAIERAVLVSAIEGFETSASSAKADNGLVASGAHELVEHDRRTAGDDPGPRLVAAIGSETYIVEGFRYIVELSQPELFVVDLLHPGISPNVQDRMLAGTEGTAFDYLVILHDSRLTVRPTGPWDITTWRMDAVLPRTVETLARLEHTLSELCQRDWERVDLPSGVVYVPSPGPLPAGGIPQALDQDGRLLPPEDS